MSRLAACLLSAALVATLFAAPTASAMNKAELIDAIAASSGLSKADSKRAMDTFTDVTAKALKKGDKIALVGFGAFLPGGPLRGTDAGDDADYESSWARSSAPGPQGKQDDPMAELMSKFDDITTWGMPPGFVPELPYLIAVNPVLVRALAAFEVTDLREENGLVWVFGPNNPETRFQVGDTVHLAAVSKVPASNGPAGASGDIGGVLTAKVADVRFFRGPGNGNRAGENVGLLLRGIEKKDIRRGMVVAKPAAHGPGRYEGVRLIGDGLVRALVAACPDCAKTMSVDDWHTWLAAFGNAIVAANANGEAVDLEGLGAFYIVREDLRSAFAPDSDFAPAQSKNTVKFKAGADLSGKVN